MEQKDLTRPDTRPPVADGWAGAEMRVFPLFNSSVTDQPTNRPTDQRTDKASYRVACPQLKTVEKLGFAYWYKMYVWFIIQRGKPQNREKIRQSSSQSTGYNEEVKSLSSQNCFICLNVALALYG